LCLALGRHRCAARFFRLAGKVERAGDACRAAGDHAGALECYREVAAWPKAAEAAMAVHDAVRAAEYFEKAGDIHAAASALVNANMASEAIRKYLDAGDRAKAAELCLDTGDRRQAARLFLESGDYDRAIKLFRNLRDTKSLLVAYAKRGNLATAAEECRENGEHLAAATLYETVGKLPEAAEMYLAAGAPEKATRLYEKVGDFTKAGDAFTLAGRLDLAVEAYQKAGGRDEAAARIYSKLIVLKEFQSKKMGADVVAGAVASVGDAAVLGLRDRNIIYATRAFVPRWQYRLSGDSFVASVALSDDGNLVAISSEAPADSVDKHALVVLDAAKQVVFQTEVELIVRDIVFLPGDGGIVAVFGDQVHCMTLAGDSKWSFQVDFRAWCVDYSPAASRIAVGSLGGTVYLFDVDGNPVGDTHFPDRVHKVRFFPDGTALGVAVGDNRIAICDLNLNQACGVQGVENHRHLQSIPGQNFLVAAGLREMDLVSSEGWTAQAAQVESTILTMFVDPLDLALHVSSSGGIVTGYRAEDCKKAAAECYAQAGDLEAAAGIYQEIEAYDKAYDIFRKLGDYEQAASTIQRIGDNRTAARHFEVVGKFDKAACLYEETGELALAANCYGKAGEDEKAGDLYEKLGDIILAADFFERAKLGKKAGGLFLLAKQSDRAVSNFEQWLKENPGDHEVVFELAKLYFEEKRHDDAIKFLQLLCEDPKYRREALRILGECFLAKHLHEVAIDRFNEALGENRKPGKDNIDLFYNIGLAYEMAGQFMEAKDAYGKVLAVDYYYKDIQQKLAHTQQFATLGSMRTRLDSPVAEKGEGGPVSGLGATLQSSVSESLLRYKIIRKVGQGGMGVVYLATDTRLNRRVAWKVLPGHLAGDREFRGRLLNEARAVAQINNPHIVAVYDIVTEAKECFITMEFIEGGNLRDVLVKQPQLPVSKAMHYAFQMADALGAAHRSNIIHRDVKPENVMISNADDNVKMVDFGLARLAEDVKLTQEGCVAGTIAYMAPEQITANPVDGRTDIYGLGAVMFEMLAGRTPFIGDNVLGQHLHLKAPGVTDFRPDTPEQLAALVSSCLAKAPEDRPRGCDQVAQSLRDCAKRMNIELV
jgi:tetratricopeptide (TPR) repeat protein